MQPKWFVRFPAIPAFLVLFAGASAAFWVPQRAVPWLAAGALAAWQTALMASTGPHPRLLAGSALVCMALSAAAAGAHEDWARRHVPLRALAPHPLTSSGRSGPVVLEGTLLDDASPGDEGVMLRVWVERVSWDRGSTDLPGGVVLSVAGEADSARVAQWTRGRRIRAPAILRRPARYLNDGVADGDLTSMRRGTALAGSVKSPLLVDVTARASPWEEACARARARVRAIVSASVDDADAAAVITAILIGDRAGLSDAIERRMQRAGTYHVIAISGGNIALFALLAWVFARAVVRSRRVAGASAILMVGAYGLLVGAGASVGRAVIAAIVLLAATLFEHRAPPLNVLAVVGIVFLVWDPLAPADLGFLLSFGATAGILAAATGWMAAIRRLLAPAPAVLRRVLLPLAAMIVATAAAEVVLLPIQAAAFHRVTVAGLVLNLAAIPAMAVAQVSGMAMLALDTIGATSAVRAAAEAARLSARVLIGSAALVDLVPVLTWRVAAPPGWVIVPYVAACALLAWGKWPRVRAALVAIVLAAGAAIAWSAGSRQPRDGQLRLTMFDVGQGEAIVLRLPSGRSMLVDAGGSSGRFDVGDRVLVPALLSRGITRLGTFVLTHPDLDHIGGALSVLGDLHPSRIIEGIAPARHPEHTVLMQAAAAAGMTLETLRAGSSLSIDGVRLDVLHPPPPEWERQKVRNDDSLVVEVVFGAVSMLLTGDAGEAVEPWLAERLAPARVRILKVGHHGSRTATAAAFLDAVRPAAALVSAGRGNFYGHPSPLVVGRLEQRGIALFRTDRDGQIDVVTDGRLVTISTWEGRTWQIAARGF